MPTVEKTRGGRVYMRSLDRQFSIGDRAEVDDAEAEYLVEERGDFEIVDDEDDVETCDEELDSGDVCGRELPCRYHSEDDEGEDEED